MRSFFRSFQKLPLLGLVCLSAVAGSPPSDPLCRGAQPTSQMAVKESNDSEFAGPRLTPMLAAQVLRSDVLRWDKDRDNLDVVLRRTHALLVNLRSTAYSPDLASEVEELEGLVQAGRTVSPAEVPARNELLKRARALRRQIAFSNPLLSFDKIVFLKHHKALGNKIVGERNHMCDQYYGFCAKPGGGIYILHDPFGAEPRVEDLLAESKVQNGRLKGRRLEGGSFISLELSYDAKTLLFAWTEARPTLYDWSPESVYHLFKVDIDGSNLTQLTDGPWNDFDPCFLPNGDIVFVSERRGGYLRCGERPNPTYTLHRMRADGSEVRTLSHHETHEWHPSVDNNGMLVFTRWDYVDRDSDIAHHLWLSYPDGRDARSYHGNYPILREHRPWMEMSIRAIPDSHKYVAVSAPHHGQAYGTLVLIDHQSEDDNALSQIRRITPEVRFPESEKDVGQPMYPKGRREGDREDEVYGTPWPLSEDYFLCVHDSETENYGIALVDSFGNMELLYRDPEISCLDPIPLLPRRVPPILAEQDISHATKAGESVRGAGTLAVVNVYDSDFEWPPDTRIAALRLIQIFPKTTPAAAKPNIGIGAQSLARGVLGTVPVEADGSAHFEVPAGVPFYLQALDERGLAVQTMRSDTYVGAGQHVTCQGCHEPKHRAQNWNRTRAPMAMARPASKIQPDVDGSYPLLFPRLVQGVLDRNCVDCHAREEFAPVLAGEVSGEFGWSRSFQRLAPFGWSRDGGNGALMGPNGGSRSLAGQVGARASKLFQMLEQGHHETSLSDEDLHRITLWLDCNTNFYGGYHDVEKQAMGVAVAPRVE